MGGDKRRAFEPGGRQHRLRRKKIRHVGRAALGDHSARASTGGSGVVGRRENASSARSRGMMSVATRSISSAFARRRQDHAEVAEAKPSMRPDERFEPVGRGQDLGRIGPGRATDRVRVAAELATGRIDDPDLVGHRQRHAVRRGAGDRRERVPLVCVAGGQPEHPRAVGGDQQRDPRLLERLRAERGVVELVIGPPHGRPVVALEAVDDLDGLLESVDPLAGRREPDAVAPMLVGVPAGSEPEDQPPTADVVHGHRLLEQHRRVAERVARDEHTEPDPARPRRDCREQRPGLETRRVGRTVRVDQMVDEPAMVEAELLGQDEPVEYLVPGPGGLAHEQAEPDRQSHAGILQAPSARLTQYPLCILSIRPEVEW